VAQFGFKAGSSVGSQAPLAKISAAELTSLFGVLNFFMQRQTLCPEFTFGDFCCRWWGGAAVPLQKI
jgi:hypothetical protein